MLNLPDLVKTTRRIYMNKFVLIYRNIFVMDLVLIFFLPLKICFIYFKTDVVCKSMRIFWIFGNFGLMFFFCILSVDRYVPLHLPAQCRFFREGEKLVQVGL